MPVGRRWMEIRARDLRRGLWPPYVRLFDGLDVTALMLQVTFEEVLLKVQSIMLAVGVYVEKWIRHLV